MNGWASNGTDVITTTAVFKDSPYCCEPLRIRPRVPDDMTINQRGGLAAVLLRVPPSFCPIDAHIRSRSTNSRHRGRSHHDL
jgi:hypothetical protein